MPNIQFLMYRLKLAIIMNVEIQSLTFDVIYTCRGCLLILKIRGIPYYILSLTNTSRKLVTNAKQTTTEAKQH